MRILKHDFLMHIEPEPWDWIEETLKRLAGVGNYRYRKEINGSSLQIYNIECSKIIFDKRYGPTTMLVEDGDEERAKRNLEFILEELRKVKPEYPYLRARI